VEAEVLSRIILDTSSLWRPTALAAAQADPRPVVVPAVAYTERVRQVLAAGRRQEELDGALALNQIEVESFTIQHGMRFAAHIHDPTTWHRLARDALIAGHVGPGDELWTTDPQDFLDLGMPPEQVVAV
jgi:predicted nucleic acid-binding protein